jgi:hypothetical protein
MAWARHAMCESAFNQHRSREPQNSCSGVVLDTVCCISDINHNAYLERGWWLRNSPITTITKTQISLTVSCFFVFTTATATYLRLPGMLFFPSSVVYIVLSMNVIRKLTSWQFSPFRPCLDVFLARLMHVWLCILTEFNRHWKLLSLSRSLPCYLFWT